MFLPSHFIFVLCIALGAYFSFKTKKLTLSASLCGGIIALLIYFSSGVPGLTILAGFFILSVLATSWKRAEKNNTKDYGSARNAMQVLANGGVAGILSILILMLPESKPILYIMVVSTLASATADTLSSELGLVYGKRFFNILTFKKEPADLDGVISVEGTLIGICGAILIASIDALFNGWDLSSAIIICSGIIGNFADSILGAAFERRGKLSNNAVNFLNTLVAAASAVFIFSYI